MRKHTGETPYVCTYLGCGKSFTQSGNLARHIRTHDEKKLFACSYCEKSFSDSSNFKRHMQIHTAQPADADDDL